MKKYCLLLFFLSITQVLSEDELQILDMPYDIDNIPIDDAMHYKLNLPDDVMYIKIQTNHSAVDNQITFFISDTFEKPVYHNSIVKAENGGRNTVVMSLKDLSIRQLYLSVYSTNTNKTFDLGCFKLEQLSIEEGEEIHMLSKYMSVYSFKPTPQLYPLFFYAIGTNIEVFSMTLKIINENGTIDKNSTQMFRNGYGIHIDLANDTDFDVSKSKIEIVITSLINENIKFGIKQLDEENTGLVLLRETIGVLDTLNQNFWDCHYIGFTKTIIVNIVSYIFPVDLILYNGNFNEIERISANLIDSVILTIIPSTFYLRIQVSNNASSSVTNFFTYSYQVIEYSQMEKSQHFLDPIVTGDPKKYIVPPGQAISIRNKKMNLESQAGLKMQLYTVEGNPNLYSHVCDQYPCDYSISKIKEYEALGTITKAHLINKNLYLYTPNIDDIDNDSPKKILSVISCEGVTDCIFYLTVYDDREIVELNSEMEFYQPIPMNNEYKLNFRLTDLLKDTVKFILYSYTGDAIFDVKNKDNVNVIGDDSFFANKKVITFSKKNPDDNILGNYEIKIRGKQYTYLSLSISFTENIGNILLSSGEIKLQTITKNESKKTYQFKNSAIATNNPFVISVNSFNCKLNITFGSKSIETDSSEQITVLPEDPQYSQEYYDVEINFVSYMTNIPVDTVLCMFYLSGIETGMDKELVLNEGVSHKMTFIPGKIIKFNYIYPLSLDISGDDIIVDITYYGKDVLLKVTFTFDGNKGKIEESTTINKGRKFLFRSQLADSCELNSMCSIHILVEPTTPLTSDLDFAIVAKALKKVPAYLNSQQYLKGIVVSDKIQYYYTDIGLNEEGEIMVNFNKGSGAIYARIVTKSLLEINADWNNHLILPNKDLDPSKMLKYDYIRKSIPYTTKETSKCNSGCELFVGIQSESYSESKSPLVSEFSIVGRQTSQNTVTKLNLNEYAYGNINKIENSDKYLFTVPFDTDEIKIHINSDVANVLITTSASTQNKWEITDPKGVLTIRKTDLKVNTMKNVEFTLEVKVTKIILLSSSYAIKVSASLQSIPSLNYLTSEQNEICIFDSPSSYCYLTRLVNNYEGVENYYMTIESMDNIQNSFEIYVNIIDALKFETKFTPEDIPNSEKHQLTSKLNLKKNILYIDTKTNPIPGDYYIIIGIKATEAGKGLFLSSTVNNMNKLTLNQNTKKMIYTKKGEKCSFSLNGANQYLVTYTLLSGKGMLTIGESLNIPLENSIVAEVPSSTDNHEFFIEALSDDIMYNVNYIGMESPSNKQLKEIVFGKENHIISAAPSFDTSYYLKVAQGKEENNILSIDVRFPIYEMSATNGTEEFIFNGYITDLSFIVDAINDPNLKPEESKKVAGIYNSFTRSGKIIINSTDINVDHEYYVYIELQPNETNTNTYSKIEPHITAYPLNNVNSIYDLPQKRYHQHTIEPDTGRNILKLSKYSDKDNKMIIEYSNCVGQLIGIAIKRYPIAADSDESELSLNDTSISTQSIFKFGKHFIEIDITDIDAIAFVVSKKTNKKTTDSLRYVIKYQTGENIKPDLSYNLQQNMETTFNETLNKTETKLFPVLDLSSKQVEADYIYQITKIGTKDKETPDSICIFQNNQDSLLQRLTLGKANNEIVFTTNEYPFEYGTYYHVSVVAIIRNGEEILLGYNGNKYKSNPFLSSWAISLIVVGSVLLLGIIAFITYYCVKRRKMISTSDGMVLNDNEANVPLRESNDP